MNNDDHFVEDVLIDGSKINYAFIVTQSVCCTELIKQDLI